jgi:hypothetical protein
LKAYELMSRWPGVTKRRIRIDLHPLTDGISRAIAEGKLSPTGPYTLRMVNDDGSDFSWDEAFREPDSADVP